MKSDFNYGFYIVYLFSLVLFSLVSFLFSFSSETDIQEISIMMDIVLSALFFIDFIIGFVQSESKKTYLKLNWYLLIACIPIVFVKNLIWVRLFRILKIIHSSFKVRHIARNMIQNLPLLSIFETFVIFFLFVFLIFYFEDSRERNFLAILITFLDKAADVSTHNLYKPTTITSDILFFIGNILIRGLLGVFLISLVSKLLQFNEIISKENKD